MGARKEEQVSDDPRSSERDRRARAQEHRGKVVEGSGQPIDGRSLAHMVSVRLDPELVKDLRRIADERGVTLSDLLREGASLVVTYASSSPYWVSVRSVKSLVETMAEVTKSPTSSTSAIRQPA